MADPARNIWAVLGRVATIGGVCGLIILAVQGARWAHDRYIADPEPVTISFNQLNTCARGKLSNLRDEGFLSEGTRLEGAAAQLAICDTEVLNAAPDLLTREIAKRYRGCLSHTEHNDTLELLAYAEAVCRVDYNGQTRYFCRGNLPAARQKPALNQIVDLSELATCPGAFLTEIGFKDQN
ncbi:hypothetical protein SAMN05444358_1011107 [Ruegeria halocynthiae]|uniref:Uncharacterized protein n=1 Tax=Ruegeria halocynthiae TaxID=985054 RepID=A0A1H2UEJ7_9RHOB|nr:hypothetical protein [Ruegeria halocynthiae]SDW54338.1 hypothetical protein SAMN05444358_1011107 [Ruegeria halocynthiae]